MVSFKQYRELRITPRGSCFNDCRSVSHVAINGNSTPLPFRQATGVDSGERGGMMKPACFIRSYDSCHVGFTRGGRRALLDDEINRPHPARKFPHGFF